HIIDWNAFGNRNDQLQSSVHCFENSIASKRGRNKDGRGCRAGGFYCFRHGIEYWNLVFKKLAALAGRDAGDDLGAVLEAELRVPRAKAARDTLNEDLGLRGEEDGHERKFTI